MWPVWLLCLPFPRTHQEVGCTICPGDEGSNSLRAWMNTVRFVVTCRRASTRASETQQRIFVLRFLTRFRGMIQGVVVLQFGIPRQSSRLPASSRPGQELHGVLIPTHQEIAGCYCLANLNIQRIHDRTGQPRGHGHSEKRSVDQTTLW